MRELQRYGLEWKSEKDFVCHPMEDGYWTPWHIAENEITTLRQQLAEGQARVADLEATLYHGNLEREKCQKAMILRKQAEAVEAARDETCIGSQMPSWHWQMLTDYAQHLRTQADAAEKEGGDS